MQRMVDGEVACDIPLSHEVVYGASRDDMLVTVGVKPYSLVVIHDRHVPEHQHRVELSRTPRAVDISPAKDTIAVMFDNGLSMCIFESVDILTRFR